MSDRLPEGFEEKEHTADWELVVWGQDLSHLLEQAAYGMNALAGVSLNHEPRLQHSLSLPYADAEELLVSFLSEILFLGEMEGLGFDRFDLNINNDQMHAQLYGAPIASVNKEIKAVTYHNLKIEKSPRGLEAHIVFDV
jgi:SHS2 domain-containing protein